mgnify:CR=1 FL=1
MIKKTLFVFLLSISIAYSQSDESKQSKTLSSIGYEMRTNGKSYLSLSYKGIILRHRNDKLENRITYNRNFFKDSSEFYLSIPLHYVLEKDQLSLEPALTYQFSKFSLLIQKEFWYNLNKDAAIVLDYPYKDFTFRVGWDTSSAFRSVSYTHLTLPTKRIV